MRMLKICCRPSQQICEYHAAVAIFNLIIPYVQEEKLSASIGSKFLGAGTSKDEATG